MRKSKKTKVKEEEIKIEESLDETENKPKEQQQEQTNSQLESSVETSFFYTNDKFINSLDNDDIFRVIAYKFPNLNGKNQDSVIKKAILAMLNDEKFINHTLDYYGMTIFDLFKLLYKKFGSIFKGTYLKKLKKTVATKSYANQKRRKTDY